MEINEIFPPYLYAAKFDGDDVNIYRLSIDKLTDYNYVINFLETFNDRISDFIVNEFGDKSEIEEYFACINDRAIDIEEEIKEICKLLSEDKISGFGEYFEPHSKQDIRSMPGGGGSSGTYKKHYLPVKCWGSSKPSLVRVYAIELSLRCYIIIYGAIKVDLKTENCPDLDRFLNESTIEKELVKRMDKVCALLKKEGIVDEEGLVQFMEED